MTTKRLSPERLAEYRDDPSDVVRELLGHIGAIQVELDETETELDALTSALSKTGNELAESRAECERLRAEHEKYLDESGPYR